MPTSCPIATITTHRPQRQRQIIAGSGFSGPGLNPAMTGAFFVHVGGSRSALDHALLYWAAPLAGAALGGLVWRRVHGPGVAAPPKRARKTRTA